MGPKILILKTSQNGSVEVESKLMAKYTVLIGNMLDTVTFEEGKDKIILPFRNISTDTMLLLI